ncbi:MAG: hypothetical protein ABI237_09925 [Ginsengibacter sp.]
MNDDLLNILSNGHKNIDNQKLMDYLSDRLSAEEKHEFEENLVDSELESDAVEGLTQFKNKKSPLTLAEELNHLLQKQLQKKKNAKEKRRIKDMPWLYFAIILIILLILIGFLVISEHLG